MSDLPEIHLSFEPFPIIRTPRLLLRAPSLGDADALFAFRSDPEAMRYIDRPLAKTPDDTRDLLGQMIAGFTANDSISWVISEHDSDLAIGTIGYWRVMRENARAEIGYMLHTQYHGKGYMQEAMTPVLQYAFRTMKLHSIEANINPANAASIRLAEKMGFVREAYFRENYYFKGRFIDSAIYSLLNPHRA
jgi:[ribosomal protein S5]-alanine N-acetyltransferase